MVYCCDDNNSLFVCIDTISDMMVKKDLLEVYSGMWGPYSSISGYTDEDIQYACSYSVCIDKTDLYRCVYVGYLTLDYGEEAHISDEVVHNGDLFVFECCEDPESDDDGQVQDIGLLVHMSLDLIMKTYNIVKNK